MTMPSKELARLLARAESLRQAIAESPLPRQWERVDLDHMAEAALMIWDQANDIAAKEKSASAPLSEAVSLIFEPLLTWSGRFDLAFKLARQRGALPRIEAAYKFPEWHPLASQFIALCFLGRFQNDQIWQRQATFEKACKVYENLSPHLESLDVAAASRIAHGWHLMGMQSLARHLLNRIGDRAAAKAVFCESNAPQFWQDTYINRSWLDALSEPI